MSLYLCAKCLNWNDKHEDCRWCWPLDSDA